MQISYRASFFSIFLLTIGLPFLNLIINHMININLFILCNSTAVGLAISITHGSPFLILCMGLLIGFPYFALTNNLIISCWWLILWTLHRAIAHRVYTGLLYTTFLAGLSFLIQELINAIAGFPSVAPVYILVQFCGTLLMTGLISSFIRQGS